MLNSSIFRISLFSSFNKKVNCSIFSRSLFQSLVISFNFFIDNSLLSNNFSLSSIFSGKIFFNLISIVSIFFSSSIIIWGFILDSIFNWAAASSIKSIALSGRHLSLMYLSASLAEQLIASSVILMP